MPDKEGVPTFAEGLCPRYQGVNPDQVKQLEPDCCERPHCEQRDWNRNALLLFEKLSGAYASINLLRWYTAQVWVCDDQGHTVDCPNQECRFGRFMVDTVDGMIAGLEAAVIKSFAGLTFAALDLRPEWETFGQIERAALTIDLVSDEFDAGTLPASEAARRTQLALGVLKSEAVENDLMALIDLFSPIRPGE